MTILRCLVALLMLAIQIKASEQACGAPLWTADLAGRYGFRTFGKAGYARRAPALWERQQGIVFISSSIVAVYQVIADPHHDVTQRDQSGGAGEFVLQVEFLDVGMGDHLGSLRVQTNSDQSGVFATHDGKFLVRAGNSIVLYSASFKQIASKILPLIRSGTADEYWRVGVTASGNRVYLEHNQSFGLKGYVSEAAILDADTLQSVASFNARGMSLWPAGDSFLVAIKDYSAIGQVNFDGEWRSLFELIYRNQGSCKRATELVKHTLLLAIFDCHVLRLLHLDGKELFNVLIDKHEEFASITGSESMIAAEVDRGRGDPFDRGTDSKPLRVSLYDLETKSERCSIPINTSVTIFHEPALYAVSMDGGAIAIIQGNMIKLWRNA